MVLNATLCIIVRVLTLLCSRCMLSSKSSLMIALYRLVETAAGRVLIDGVDIATLGLEKLRQSMAIIPQDPVVRIHIRNTLRH